MKHFRSIAPGIICLILVVLVLSTISPVSAFPVKQTSQGKQIVFMLGDSGQKFVLVSITGTNQNNEVITWKKEDKNGFSLAYTKDWWWIGNSTQISFTIQNDQGIQVQKTCVFDTLAQPAGSPRVEIVYYQDKGCIGGEAGSANDPIQNSIMPVRQAFTAIWNFLPEDKFDFFMTLMNNEINATGCVLGLSAIVKTGGFAAMDGTVRNYVQKTCQNTFNMVITLFKE